MIQNEEELRCTYITLAKMYKSRENSAKEESWDPSLREMVVDGIDAQIREVEQEVEDYFRNRFLSEQKEQNAAPVEKAA